MQGVRATEYVLAIHFLSFNWAVFYGEDVANGKKKL